MRRQLFRSSAVPWRIRGNHARGIEIVRPSSRSKIKLSSVTETFCAKAIRISIAKVLIPCPQQAVLILLHKSEKPIYFIAAESSAIVQPDRIEPKFGYLILSFDMHMSRLILVTGIEEKPM
jgi:hypothetical protein